MSRIQLANKFAYAQKKNLDFLLGSSQETPIKFHAISKAQKTYKKAGSSTSQMPCIYFVCIHNFLFQKICYILLINFKSKII